MVKYFRITYTDSPWTIWLLPIPSYRAEQMVVRTGPSVSGHPSISAVVWWYSECLATHSHLHPVSKPPLITWLPFAAFPAGFPRKSLGKLTGKVACHWQKSLPPMHLPPPLCIYAGLATHTTSPTLLVQCLLRTSFTLLYTITDLSSHSSQPFSTPLCTLLSPPSSYLPHLTLATYLFAGLGFGTFCWLLHWVWLWKTLPNNHGILLTIAIGTAGITISEQW